MAAPSKRKCLVFFVAAALALVVFAAMQHRPASPLSRAFDEIRIGMRGDKIEEILARAPGETDDVSVSVLLEGSTESIILEGKSGETMVIRCRRNGTKVLGGCVVDKEYSSRFTMIARNWIDHLRRWLKV